ncbi:DNA topoisomerase [uncultured Psychrobacter sp.]|uniref:DNA topoisomerase n=1 Tax=uncultured Psychrobacter sp. TaxID=259303 RepID=UPI002595A0FA|nr:DNA topoisomerase [uncultured Psychrobacter sp.]
MSNSAHDDITVLDTNALSYIKDKDLRTLFELIMQMEEAEQLGDAVTIKQIIELSRIGKNGKLPVVFEVESVIQSGWWESELSSNPRCKPKLSVPLTQNDIDAIKRGDFTVSLEESLPNVGMLRLDELIEQMEIYGISRPSTMPGVLTELMDKSSLVDINLNLEQVSVTDAGKKVDETLKAHLGDIGSLEWNGKVSGLLGYIEAGKLSADILILMVYEDLFGLEERKCVEHVAWTDPEVLYSPPDTQKRVGGVLSKTYKPAT